MPPSRTRSFRIILGAIFLGGLILRLVRLNWQPLWWDEGYSVYFATEPIDRMFWLTANDIHPPLYYLLLHGWYGLINHTDPVVTRLLSVGIGAASLAIVVWCAAQLFPKRPQIALGVAVLLALNPMHLFYSQEVRMYGLALLLLLVASTAFWRMVTDLEGDRTPWRWWWLYVGACSLALWTLYFSGLWLVAHQVWLLFHRPVHKRTFRWSWTSALAILLLQLPWWLYALPRLVPYVADKVVADQDRPLGLFTYLWRHWLAWTAGHLTPVSPTVAIGVNVLAGALLLALVLAVWFSRHRHEPVIGWLAALVGIPLALGFLVNLRFPFFPEGGERLQLAGLPFLLLLIVATADSIMPRTHGWALACALLLLPSAVGVITFFTLPRHVDHDYRPIVRYVVQHARTQDSVLALFPWQIGYWRAYSPHAENGDWLAPQPQPVDQAALVWSPQLAQQLDVATESGTLWFPAPLSFGSTLPAEIEAYLLTRTHNVDNRWFSSATRLSAWAHLSARAQSLNPVDFGQVSLVSGLAGPESVVSGNEPLAIDLVWGGITQVPAPWRATLRLEDELGHTWTQRDLAQIGLYARSVISEVVHESVALVVPPGLPPGNYALVMGVGPAFGAPELAANVSISTPDTLAPADFADLGKFTVVAPDAPLPADRLPVEHPLRTPQTQAGVTLLGYNGPSPGAPLLAGDQLGVTLMAQGASHPLGALELYIALVDAAGDSQASWVGWPVPSLPTTLWSEGQLAQLPITLDLPAAMPAGAYSLVAGFIDSATSTKSEPVALADFDITRRTNSFTLPKVTHVLTESVQFGTHVELIGYDVVFPEPPEASMDNTPRDAVITLTWRVLQPLLPPHHIFVHALDEMGEVLAQADGVPTTAAGLAPSGSWLPGEYIQTINRLSGVGISDQLDKFQVGLYAPTTLVRLPAARAGQVYGDTADIPVQP